MSAKYGSRPAQQLSPKPNAGLTSAQSSASSGLISSVAMILVQLSGLRILFRKRVADDDGQHTAHVSTSQASTSLAVARRNFSLLGDVVPSIVSAPD
jgi:hypothetical protein